MVNDSVLIRTVDYTSLPTSTTVFFSNDNKLDKRAKKRVFVIQSTLDVVLSGGKVAFYDSSLGEAYLKANEVSINVPGTAYTSGNGSVAVTYQGELGANLNSVRFFLYTGSTAPTTGTVKLYVIEVL